MGKGAAWASDLLRLYFHGTAIFTVADNASVPFSSHTVALHTADPGSGGSQLTHETSYLGYARAMVPRNASGWTVLGATVSPADDIAFGQCTGSPGPKLTYWSVSRGGGTIDYVGKIKTPIHMDTQVVPVLTSESTITEV